MSIEAETGITGLCRRESSFVAYFQNYMSVGICSDRMSLEQGVFNNLFALMTLQMRCWNARLDLYLAEWRISRGNPWHRGTR